MHVQQSGPFSPLGLPLLSLSLYEYVLPFINTHQQTAGIYNAIHKYPDKLTWLRATMKTTGSPSSLLFPLFVMLLCTAAVYPPCRRRRLSESFGSSRKSGCCSPDRSSAP